MKKYAFIGHAVFLYLIILSALYYQERAIFLDTALHSFQLINGESPFFVGRITSIIPMILPWIAIALKLKLSSVLFLYSISFTLLFYSIFILITHYFKNYTNGLILTLCTILCMRESFYYAVTEVHQLIGYSILFLTVLQDREILSKNLKYILEFLLIVLIFLCHPYGIFTVSFILIFNYLENKNIKYFTVLLGITAIIFLMKDIFFIDVIEKEKLGFAYNFLSDLPHFFELPLTQFIINHTGKFTFNYLPFFIVFTASISISLIQKKWFQAILITIFTFLFIALNNSVMADGESGIVLEKTTLTLAIFSVIPLIYALKKINQLESISAFVLIVIIIGIKTRDVSLAIKPFEKRLNYISELVEESRDKNTPNRIMEWESINQGLIKIPWALPIETLLKSSLDNKEAVTIVTKIELIDDNSEQFFFINKETRIPRTSLNQKYFNLSEENYIKD
jgi:hypothetical protein